LRRYTNASMDPEIKECLHWNGHVEGLDIHRCLSHVNVKIVESRDESEHETFLPIPIKHQFLEGYDNISWLRNLTYHKVPGVINYYKFELISL